MYVTKGFLVFSQHLYYTLDVHQIIRKIHVAIVVYLLQFLLYYMFIYICRVILKIFYFILQDSFYE